MGDAGESQINHEQCSAAGFPMHLALKRAMATKLKVILGGILLLLGIIFAAQNAAGADVNFLGWSLRMSQALVIFLSSAAGILIGFFFGTTFKGKRAK